MTDFKVEILALLEAALPELGDRIQAELSMNAQPRPLLLIPHPKRLQYAPRVALLAI